MAEVKERTPEELEKITNEMDPNTFAAAIINSKFWEWAQNPDSAGSRETKEILLKKFNIKDSPLLHSMIAFHAGVDAGLDIAKVLSKQ